MATSYAFATKWTFNSPIQQVWDVIGDIRRYPEIWSDFRRVQVRAGDGRSVGSIIDAETRGRLPYSLNYTLEVVESDEPHHVLLKSTGDLVGTGRWELRENGPSETRVTYYWDVATTNPILNLLAPLFKGALAKNHDEVMARGYDAFSSELRSPPATGG
jgi:ribosome-associated toxin RatA of RatAB toxin-antitoxin module